MSTLTHEARQAELNTRVEAIDTQVATLNEERHAAALPATAGEKEAIKLIARLDDQIDQLLRERQTISNATDMLEVLIAASGVEAQAQAQAKREREIKARDAASALMALNEQLDAHLLQLKEMFERRSALLQGLAATEVMSHSLISRLQGKAPATAAACKLGLQKYLDLVTVSPISHRPLADANSILTTVGKQ